MSLLKLKPNFNRINRSLAFPAKQLNYILEESVVDKFSFYQAFFMVYSFMKLTEDLKHKIFSVSSNPFVWQAHDSCNWSPMGNAQIGEQEISPCKAKVNDEWCYDELFKSCFSHFLKWGTGNTVSLGPEGRRLVNIMVRQMIQNMVVGARLTLTVGKLYDYDKLKGYFKTGVTGDMKAAFAKTMGTCRGWVELAKEQALKPGYEHLNCKEILTKDMFNGKKFMGKVVEDVFDKLRGKCLPELQCLLDEGGVPDVQGLTMSPLLLVSQSIYSAVAEEYRKMCVSVTCINPRIERKAVSWNGRQYNVYYIDGVPVIPISDINCYDSYLTGSTHLAVLTVSGNINMGASFANLPTIDRPGMGVRIQQHTDNDKYGKYSFLSHALFSTAIANHKLFAGTQIFCAPKKAA